MKTDRIRIKRSHVETAAAPAWVVTYADFVTLLLCIFVAILSMSTINQDRFQTALGSLRGAFGTVATVESEDAPDHSLYGRLRGKIELQTPTSPISLSAEPTTTCASISRTPLGAKLVLAGPLAFERGKSELSDPAQQMIAQVAEELKGRRYVIIVRGHCAGESPRDGELDVRDLSYARAAAVARILEQGGVPAAAISVMALGEGEPQLLHAYTERRRAMNRRVEIEVLERDELNATVRVTQSEKG